MYNANRSMRIYEEKVESCSLIRIARRESNIDENITRIYLMELMTMRKIIVLSSNRNNNISEIIHSYMC